MGHGAAGRRGQPGGGSWGGPSTPADAWGVGGPPAARNWRTDAARALLGALRRRRSATLVSMVGPTHRALVVVLIGVGASFFGVGQPWEWAHVCFLLLGGLVVTAYWCWPPYDLAAKLRIAGRLTTSADEAERRRGVGLYMRIVEEHGPSLEACLNLAACHEVALVAVEPSP